MTDMGEPAAYRVLARKYRPQSFAELIGQEAMVRTLTNAIADATGLRFNDLPVTPDRVFAALEKRARSRKTNGGA